jgi:hypothetical protein
MSHDGLLWHRIQFGFTVTFHYLYPQLTMGLALLIVLFTVIALRRADERYDEVARFWARIFGLNFAMGVVTGIPLEFQFGTNWAWFSSIAVPTRKASASAAAFEAVRLWAGSKVERIQSRRLGSYRRPRVWSCTGSWFGSV